MHNKLIHDEKERSDLDAEEEKFIEFIAQDNDGGNGLIQH